MGKFKIGDEIIFNVLKFHYEGEVIGFSSEIDKTFGDYEIRFYNSNVNQWHRCAASDYNLSLNIKGNRLKRLKKLKKIMNMNEKI